MKLTETIQAGFVKASYLKASFILLFVILTLGFVAIGCKKEIPPPQEPTGTAPSTQEQIAKEKEFLLDPDVAMCELEETTISRLELPRSHMASFIYKMKRNKKEDLRHGRISLGNRPYRILLGERPEGEFYLYDIETGEGPYWLGSWSMHSYHKLDGKFFEFMLVEDGAKIAGRPYKGKFGTIKVGKGGRDLHKAEFSGSVFQAGHVSVPIGIIKEHGIGRVPECRIPAGDYTPDEITVKYDNLIISISNNYYTNAKGQSKGKEVVYGMNVREDKPYILDFSNRPMVFFDQPPMSETSFSRGQEIEFAALMIDPKLDIMIRGLDDTSVQVSQVSADGREYNKRAKSLDPKVVITRADGEVVAEGVMPFG